MSPSSPSPASSPAADLRRLARTLAESLDHRGPSLLVLADDAAPGSDAAFGAVRVVAMPATVAHPADPFVGLVADPAVAAVGLASFGRLRPLAGRRSCPRPSGSSVVVLADRAGRFASDIRVTDEPALELDDPPEGWVADVLRRVLGLPTAPPDQPLSAFLEDVWMDAIAQMVLGAPRPVRTWAALARLHPLAPAGRAPSAPGLATLAREIDATSSWPRMRSLWLPLANAELPPPPKLAGLHPTPVATWFDDGMFARWSHRNLVPGEDLVPAVCDALADELIRRLDRALTSLDLAELADRTC